MGTRHDAQGTICHIAVIEMQSDGNHALHDGGGWLNVNNTGLSRPRSKAEDVVPLSDGNRQILMERNFPIGGIRLVKERCSHCVARIADDSARERLDPTILAEAANRWNINEVAYSKHLTVSAQLVTTSGRIAGISESLDLVRA